MSEMLENQTMGWDDSISNDGKEFVLLNEGDYVFTVVDFQRGSFSGSAKLPACNKAILTLEMETAEGPVRMNENLLLLRSMEWKMSAFFRAIGQKKHGEELKPNWNKVLGAQGVCHIKPRKYVGNDGNEKTTNSIDYYIDYMPEKIREVMQKQAQPVIDQMEEDIPF